MPCQSRARRLHVINVALLHLLLISIAAISAFQDHRLPSTARQVFATSSIMAGSTLRRSRFGVVALGATAALLCPSALRAFVGSTGKATLRGAVQTRRTAMPYIPPPMMNPLPWSDDLEGKDAQMHNDCLAAVDDCVDNIQAFDKGLDAGMSEQQLHEYDEKLAAGVRQLEDIISRTQAELAGGASAAQRESQRVWLDSILQSVGDLRRQLQRIRDVEGKLHSRMAKTDRGFLQSLIRAAAVAIRGHKGVLKGDYPASGVQSYSGLA
eukprot:TRINITY_DN28685_c0_g1_i1.p1 TRINITY_DN28685_c0_g1~~TRINITY_DN28685_c0_g1_i1.p1  ORF type:complete len:267 (-),score=49.15 TRINITY_DN28685_c0_g1_i1:446-1246(-)